MGSGTWSADTYASAAGARVSSGATFGYSHSTRSAGRSSWKSHEDLDPKKKAGDTSTYAGQVMKESRDSDEHPNSLPICVMFDATGSMGSIPSTVQARLTTLFGLLVRKGYAEDPQIMIGAYGDAYVDRVPLQLSQFESDNRIDDNLDNLFLEGGGGGNMGETQTLAWYYLANHTSTDAFEKRNKKGYAFFIADERALDLRPEHVKENLGVDEVQGDITAKGLAKTVQEKWDTYILLIDNASAAMQKSKEFYENLFGKDHVLVIQDVEAISETIGVAIGLLEGNIDLDDSTEDLADMGVDRRTIESVKKSTAGLDIITRSATEVDVDLVGPGAARL